MKRISLLFSLLAMLVSITVNAQEQNPDATKIGDIYYILSPSDHTAAVTWGTKDWDEEDTWYNEGCYIGEVTIPSTVTYNDITYSVTTIDDGAFVESQLTSITIPNSVTTIGRCPFYDCTALTSLTIPSSVTTIKADAFEGCDNLTSITVESRTPISLPDGDPFPTISYLVDRITLHVPAGTKQAYKAAQYWTRVNNIVEDVGSTIVFADELVKTICVSNWDVSGDGELGEKEAALVTDIGTVFRNNNTISSFNEFQYFTGVTSLNENSYYGCTALTSITIPKNVTTISSNPFRFCDALVNIVVTNDNTTFDSRNSSNAIIETATNTLITGCKNTVIPNTVSSIGLVAFQDARFLSSINIPNSVTSIGSGAFKNCTRLTDIQIPESVTSIGGGAFYNCSSLDKAYFASMESLCSIDFQWSGISGETYSSNPSFYAEDLYIDGVLLTGDVIIPEGVESIGTAAFYKCRKITSVHIPSSVRSIGQYAFYLCTNLSSINLPEISRIERYSFYGCPFTSISIPSSVTWIRDYAFCSCRSLNNIVWPENLEYIDNAAFNLCENLSSVVLPKKVKSLGESAFDGCSSLESISIPNTVTYIGSAAFYGCSNLTSMYVYWENPITITYPDVFSYRTNATLYVPYDHKSAYEAAYYWKDFKEIVETPAPVQNITFADANVKALCVDNWDTNGDGELSYTEAAAVTDLGTVFEYNTQITSFDELQYFTGLTSIGESAFYGCTSLTSLTISQSVTSINNQAFLNCGNLETIVVDEHNTTYDSRNHCNAIIKTSSNGLVKGCKNTIIPEDITFIGNYAFQGCNNLSITSFPESVDDFGEYAFAGATINEIVIPTSVTYIGKSCFSNATINRVEIPYSETPIRYSCREDRYYAYTVFTDATIGTLIIDRLFSRGGSSTEHVAPFFRTKIDKVYEGIHGQNWYSSSTIQDFYYLDGITDVDQNSSFTSTGSGYDYSGGNSTIERLHIPEGVTTITKIYQGKNINIPSTVTTIAADAFEPNMYNTLVLPAGIQSIGERAFAYISSVKSITCLAENPIEINENVFPSNAFTKPLYVPVGSKGLYEAASGWSNFSNIIEIGELGNPIQFADPEIKSRCVKNYDVNGDGELSEGEALLVTSIKLYDSTSNSSNSSITSFDELGTYFTNLTSIAYYAFGEFRNMTSITIPNSVTSIEVDAFYYCIGLTSVTIPSNVTSIDATAFRRSGLSTIVVDPNNTTYDSRDNCNAIIETATNTLISGCKNTAIPNSVTTIGNNAFYGCSGLTSVTIPNSVTSISDWAFYDCRDLTSIVSEIEEPFAFGSNAFNGIASTCTLTVPAGTRDAYIAAGWTENVFKGGVVEAPEPTVADLTADIYHLWDGTGADATVTNPTPECTVNLNVETGIVYGDNSVRVDTYADLSDWDYLTLTVTSGSPRLFFNSHGEEDRIIVYPYNTKYVKSNKNGIITYDLAAIKADAGYVHLNAIKAGAWDSQVVIGEMKLATVEEYVPENPVRRFTDLTTDMFHQWTLEEPVEVTNLNPYCVLNLFQNENNIYGDPSVNPDQFADLAEWDYLTIAATNGTPRLLFNRIHNPEAEYGTEEWKGSNWLEINSTDNQYVVSAENGIIVYDLKAIREDCNGMVRLHAIKGKNGPATIHALKLSTVDPAEIEWNNIYFADTNVKALCVANWDTNEDGELDKDEAAAVTSLGEVFKGNTDITSFNELQYFTGITSIGENAFNECSNLASVVIPNSVATISHGAFQGAGLTEMVIPSSMRTIEYNAFAYCSNLATVTFEEGTTNVGGNVFAECPNLEEVVFPSTLSSGNMHNVFGSVPKLRHVVMPISAPRCKHAELFQGGDLNHSVLFTIPEGSARIYLEKGYYNISDMSELAWMKTEFEAEVASVEALATAEGITASAAAKEALQTAITAARAAVDDADSYLAIGTQMDAVKTAAKTFLGTATITAGTDVTAIVRNPQFDRMDFGWNVEATTTWQGSSVGYQKDNEHTNGEVNIHNFLEAWWNDVRLGDGRLVQTLTSLPAGIYRLEADAIATWQADANVEVTGVSLLMGNSTRAIATANEKPEHFSVLLENTKTQDVTIGVQWSNTTANWVAVDNFRLIYEGAAVTPAGSELVSSEDDTYYIYNVGTGMYLNGGNGFGTQAVLAEMGLPVRMTQDGDGYWEIYFREGSRHEQKLYRSNYYDRIFIDYVEGWGAKRWIITPQDGNYTIQLEIDQGTNVVLGNNPNVQDYDVSQNVTLDTHIEVIRTDNAAHNTVWQFIKAEDYDLLMAKHQLLAAIFRMEQSEVDNEELLNNSKEVYYNAEATLREVISATALLNSQMGMPQDGQPVDMTVLITNPRFEHNTDEGWIGAKLAESDNPNTQFETHEFYKTPFNMHQKIMGVPNGLYRLKYKGYHRPGSGESACADYVAGTNNASAVVYANGEEKTLKHIYEDASDTSYGGGETEYNGKYVPKSQAAARQYFNAGLYADYLEVEVTDNILTIGVKNTEEMGTNHWVIFSDFELELMENAEQISNRLTTNDVTCSPGGSSKLTVSLTNSEEIASGTFRIVLPEGVTPTTNVEGFIQIKKASRFPAEMEIKGTVGSDGVCNFAIMASGTIIPSGDGALFSIMLCSDASMELGEYNIVTENTKLVTTDLLRIQPFSFSSTLTLAEPQSGDVNGDGETDILDATYIVYYFLHRPLPVYYEEAGDVNGDGETDILDATIIAYKELTPNNAPSRAKITLDPQ